MDQITHEVRLANWKSIVEQCQTRPEGQTAKQWLREHGISEKNYYYWQRKVRQDDYYGAAQEYPYRLIYIGLTQNNYSLFFVFMILLLIHNQDHLVAGILERAFLKFP